MLSAAEAQTSSEGRADLLGCALEGRQEAPRWLSRSHLPVISSSQNLLNAPTQHTLDWHLKSSSSS